MSRDKMTYEERLVWYATAPRAGAMELSQITDHNLVKFYGSRLRGNFVESSMGWKFDTKEDALESARLFRQSCLDEAIKLALIDQVKGN